MGSSLPPKEANLFKLIVKAYESKQYKKGLKASDAILKRFPDHGETLAMRGLTLNCHNRKAEAYELVRRGLKNDLKSHVCWHVYGLLYRSDREYREAIKCYLNALRLDPDNLQILRDLSLLQAQMRDRAGFVETRRQLLTLKPSHRNSWIGFAVAQHINGNPAMAVQIVQAYEGTLEEDFPPENERYEHSEMLMYKVLLLEECGASEKAFDELSKQEQKILDKLSLKERRAALLLQLRRPAEAEKVYRSLLALNSDNYRYYEGLQACLGLKPTQGGAYAAQLLSQLTTLYSDLQKQYPHSTAAKRIPLDFLQGAAFLSAAEAYVRPFLQKGVPSIFSDLKPLYRQPGKADALEHLFLDIESSMRSEEMSSSKKEDSQAGVASNSSPTLLWTLFLLAQHYNKRKQCGKALKKIDEAILRDNSIPDFYLVKGRVLKYAGDQPAAAALADEARTMDLADRFLNSECVKRLLEADQIDKAEKTAALFTKDGEQHNNLFDMQCMWYEIASGNSHLRQREFGKALKKYLAVHKHYTDIVEDQFDFHTYCLRKMTLKAYVSMLQFEDHLHSHKFFCRGAAGAIRCYLEIFDAPPKTSADDDDALLQSMSPSERKKLRQKQRKAEARAKKVPASYDVVVQSAMCSLRLNVCPLHLLKQYSCALQEAEDRTKQEEAAATAAATSPGAKGSKKTGTEKVKAIDPDPDGVQLAQVDDPLGEAIKSLQLLQLHASDRFETHLLAFEVYIRRRKILLGLQALKRMLRLDSHSAALHRSMVRFFHLVESLPSPKTAGERLVQEVVEAEKGQFAGLDSASLQAYNDAFLKSHSGSLPHRLAAAEMSLLLTPTDTASAVRILERAEPSFHGRDEEAAEATCVWSLRDCVAVDELLKSKLQDTAASASWRARCQKLFPYAACFEADRSSAVVGLPSRTALVKERAALSSGTPQVLANGI
eukprot:SM000029S10575  [mRNA]  locus=s29:885212:893102:- [translate_table: standard]